MEAKHKVIIAVLVLALVFVISVVCLNKPKKFDKQKAKENALSNEKSESTTKETTPIVVNNNIDTNSLVEKLMQYQPQRIQSKDKVVEEIDAEDCADRMYNSMLGHGTDARALLQCFEYIDDDEEFDDVMEVFEQKYGEPFDAVLAREMFSKKIIANKINEMLCERNIQRIIEIE